MTANQTDAALSEDNGHASGGLSRLKNRADFLRAAKARKWATASLVLQCRRRRTDEIAAPDEIRVGFTASKKVGDAVARNRAKRRLRALARDILGTHARAGHDYVLIGRTSTLDRPYRLLIEDLTEALNKVHAPAKHRAKREKSRKAQP